MLTIQKLPPVIEDLRHHTPEQLLELRLLLNTGALGRADRRRPGFYEMDGVSNTYYVFRYPTGHKVLLVAAWDRDVGRGRGNGRAFLPSCVKSRSEK